ncbi:HTH-type transcriptional regulator PksA [Zafaria cholistanensis]|uniref:HTH-type transcriptional regulator PksA n=1 Tax=Zafaria cholistanensis TaxID=1682741 RepID=A0A5A7NQD0_9MICC|nr:TetR/AcrR family transcriptional regulator [Zafaria cholistanensis]GER23154.1 HTH-type transcriptional regulator PksA [Zafaria cholistanensis]
MPKIVDHERRREEIVETTWRIIARYGLDAATLRDVAAEAGFANGAVKPYFPTKASLLLATFAHVFKRTSTRINLVTEGKGGFEALRAFCLEVLPLDEERIDEARVVIAFWPLALQRGGPAELYDAVTLDWRRKIRAWLREARAAGAAPARLPVDAVAETLLTFLQGAQVAAVFDPDFNTPDQLEAQLDAHLGLLGAQ